MKYKMYAVCFTDYDVYLTSNKYGITYAIERAAMFYTEHGAECAGKQFVKDQYDLGGFDYGQFCVLLLNVSSEILSSFTHVSFNFSKHMAGD